MSSDLDCNKIMCKYKLNSREDAKKWLLKNHPDKGGDVDSGIFTDVTKCFQAKEFCSGPKKKNTEGKEGMSSADRATMREKIYTCMRQTENWSKILKTQRFDNASFNESAVIEAIHDSSPKLEQLLRIIKQVDENDMREHGKLFKHFIFSDVKAGGYGAKILASAFIAEGYTNLLEARNTEGRKSVQLALGRATGAERSNAFCILSSSTLFESSLNQKLKKRILQTYNKRPENIHGEEMRFIILDSGFKEGIDLFDVKYVHIFELSMTIADLKQTVGRATRTCGQKGLNFEPNVGWPLYVYNYYIAIPEEIKDLFHATDPELLDDKDSEYIFKNKDKLKDATMLYSKFDKAMVNLSEQLYRLAPVFSVDFELTKNIHKTEDITYLYDGESNSDTDTDEDTDEDNKVLAVRKGGARRVKPTAMGADGLAKRAGVPRAIGTDRGSLRGMGADGLAKRAGAPRGIACSGKCGLRSTKDIPATVSFLKEVYLRNKHNRNALPKKHPREYLCAYMKQSPAYCEQLNSEWARRAASVPKMMEEKMHTKRNTPSANKSKSKKITPSAKDKPSATRKRKYKLVFTDAPVTLAKEVMKELDLVPIEEPNVDINKYAIVEYKGHVEPAMKQKIPGPPPRKLNFAKMRDFIKTNYAKDFTWPPYKIENKCGGSMSGGSLPGDREFTAVEQAYGPGGSRGINADEIMDYDTTQFRLQSDNNVNTERIYTDAELAKSSDESDNLAYNQTGSLQKGGSWFSLPGEQEYIQDQEAYGNGMNQGGKDIVYQESNSFSQDRPCVDSGSYYSDKGGVTGVTPVDESSDTAYNQTGQAGAGYTGGASRAMTLNPTQDFARRFFTPESPYKGMLLWHSVGTGKTCSAVAVASSSFEQAGYTILWVTRTTLKSDVYKNIFDDVCHAILAEKMRKEGLKIPDKNRRRLLSDSWIEPISYRTFSNLLDAKPGSPHKLRQLLEKRNNNSGSGDILRKTLIVIDEAHKLYGGDLKASERPKMAVMERWLRESYAKSGPDSARLLIMTATPFTDSPMEMFKLINLCKEDPAEHITTDPAEFKTTYMSKEDVITSKGSKALANSLSGYISYLNRENDPTQFAQPIMIEVPAIMSHVEDADLRDHFYSSGEDKKEARGEDKDVVFLVKEQLKAKKAKAKQDMKDFKEELKTVKKTSKNVIKERKSKCRTIKNKADKAECVKTIEEEEGAKLARLLEKVQADIAKLKEEILEMKKKPAKNAKRDVKEQLALLKRRLLQESMLVKRCKSIKMKRKTKKYLATF